MRLIKFTIKDIPIYIIADTIVSFTPAEDGTEITTVNHNEFYHVDQNIGEIIKTLKSHSLIKQIINTTNG